MKIAVVIPAYNEARHIELVLHRLPATIKGHAVIPIVVDDGSRDKTSQVAAAVKGVQVIRHRTNLGKGAAVKTGCDAAYQLGADIFVLMDSDGQHRPEDIEKLVTPILDEGKNRLVIGTRSFSKKMPLAMRVGNQAFTRIMKFIFQISVRDTQSGFRAFSRDLYPSIRWAASNYAMETEMLVLGARSHVEFAEVGIDTIYLNNHKGTTPLDGLRILKTILKLKLTWSQGSNSSESSLG
ncbi:MAG: glycosyltransferase family 2 protein [bacterium]